MCLPPAPNFPPEGRQNKGPRTAEPLLKLLAICINKPVGGISEGEWVYIAALDDVYGENGMITEAKIIIESIEPIRFVLN